MDMDTSPSPENTAPASPTPPPLPPSPPPPLVPPPPVIAPAVKPRKTRGWMVATLILLFLLGLSLLGNLGQLVSHGLNFTRLKAGSPRAVGPKLTLTSKMIGLFRLLLNV